MYLPASPLGTLSVTPQEPTTALTVLPPSGISSPHAFSVNDLASVSSNSSTALECLYLQPCFTKSTCPLSQPCGQLCLLLGCGKQMWSLFSTRQSKRATGRKKSSRRDIIDNVLRRRPRPWHNGLQITSQAYRTYVITCCLSDSVAGPCRFSQIRKPPFGTHLRITTPAP